MSRIEIVICDGCANEIEDGPVTSIMVPEEDQWLPLDLCSKDCVLSALGYQEDEQPQLPFQAEELDPLLEELSHVTPLRMRRREAIPEGMDDGLSDETFTPEPPPIPQPKELSPDEKMANEKLYREQAAQITEDMTGVRSRTMGRR